MLPILLFLGGALALIGVLHELPPTSNVELFHGTSLMTPDVMEAFLVYLPTSPAVEGTAVVVGDIIGGASTAVADIVDTIRNSAVLAPPGLIWLSETSRSDISYYGSDYFHNLDFVLDDFVLFDALDGADMAKGTGALLAMDTPSFMLDEAPDADKTVTVDATVNSNRTEDIDGDCYSDDGDGTVEYGLFLFCSAIWIYCLWDIIPFIGKLAYKLPLVKSLVDDFRGDLKNIPFLLFQLVYVCAWTYLLEEAVLGVFFFDPLARIGWLMERGRVDGTFLAQEFAVIYLWVWWRTVVPAERARARLDIGLEGVVAGKDWVWRDTDDGAYRETSNLQGSMTRRVLEMLDEEYTRAHRAVDVAKGLQSLAMPTARHEAMLRLDGLG